jgi:tetratricopeptide (TPR) repeat protein
MKPSRLAFAALLWHALLVGACQTSPLPTDLDPEPAPSAAARATRPEQEDSGYGALLASLDAKIATAQAAVETGHPNSWSPRERLAALLLERAQLTSRAEDYVHVQTVLDDAFAVAPRLSGPVLLAARFNTSIHRLDEADFYLGTIAEHAVVTHELHAGARLLAAQVALARGDYETARAVLEEFGAASPALVQTDLALYHAQTGDVAKAEALYKEAFDQTKPTDGRRRAWIRLQLAVLAMEHGRYEHALRTLQDADRELPGWWLIEEHIAEVLTLLGRDQDAVPLYEKVVRETELPQYLDALAAVYERLNRSEEARDLVTRAGAAWDRQLAELPESAMGHGLDHFLEHRTPEQALELAKRNHSVRPGGEAHVGLARAYLKAGQPHAAIEIVERALKTPYRSADLHDTAREAYAAVGATDAAEAQRALCLASNPRFQH